MFFFPSSHYGSFKIDRKRQQNNTFIDGFELDVQKELFCVAVVVKLYPKMNLDYSYDNNIFSVIQKKQE